MSVRRTNRALVLALKAQPCADCGGEFPAEAMDLDHVTPSKRGNLSDLLGIPTAELLDELTHCEVVCANCHRARTAVRRTEAHLAAADDADLRFEHEEAPG